jgi:hypothetical protein
MTYFLHIGPHKTGTSYIQKECASRRLELLGAGINYPTYWNTFLYAHQDIYDQLSQEHYDYFKSNFSEWKKRKTPSEHVLLSSENLEDLSPEAVGVLAEPLRAHKTKIIFYVCSWLPLVRSKWQEDIKHGGTVLFPEFCFQNFVDPELNRTLNYNLVLDTYAKFFGSENIIIRSYDNIVDTNGDVFEDIISIVLGKPSPFQGRRYLENVGFPPLETEVIRVLNSVLQRKLGLPPSAKIRECFIEKIEFFGKQMAELETRSAAFLRSFAMNEPEQAFRKVQDHLLTKYPSAGPDVENGRLFASQKTMTYQYYSPEFLADSVCAEVLQQLLHAVEHLVVDRVKAEKLAESSKIDAPDTNRLTDTQAVPQ